MNILQKVINFIIKEMKFKDPSMLIALYPDEETIENIIYYRNEIAKLHDLSSMRELEPEELHATIRWWKASQGNYHRISEDLSFFKLYEPVDAKIEDVDILGDSLSLMLDSVSMQRLFCKIDNMVQGHGGPPSDFPYYKPHIALFYGDWDDVVVDQVLEVPDFPIHFDRLKMTDNSGNIYFDDVWSVEP